MHTLLRRSRPLLAAVALLAGGAAWAQVSVHYSKAEEFADVPRAAYDRERLLRDVSAHFAELGKTLPAGLSLDVEVLDIDLAGRMIWPRRGTDELRLMTGGADWPRMHLRYTLQAGDQVLARGDSQLSDMMYQQQLNRYSSGDPLRYEKRMLDEWFKKEILHSKGQS